MFQVRELDFLVRGVGWNYLFKRANTNFLSRGPDEQMRFWVCTSHPHRVTQTQNQSCVLLGPDAPIVYIPRLHITLERNRETVPDSLEPVSNLPEVWCRVRCWEWTCYYSFYFSDYSLKLRYPMHPSEGDTAMGNTSAMVDETCAALPATQLLLPICSINVYVTALSSAQGPAAVCPDTIGLRPSLGWSNSAYLNVMLIFLSILFRAISGFKKCSFKLNWVKCCGCCISLSAIELLMFFWHAICYNLQPTCYTLHDPCYKLHATCYMLNALC